MLITFVPVSLLKNLKTSWNKTICGFFLRWSSYLISTHRILTYIENPRKESFDTHIYWTPDKGKFKYSHILKTRERKLWGWNGKRGWELAESEPFFFTLWNQDSFGILLKWKWKVKVNLNYFPPHSEIKMPLIFFKVNPSLKHGPHSPKVKVNLDHFASHSEIKIPLVFC